jgi:hypothetical protein
MSATKVFITKFTYGFLPQTIIALSLIYLFLTTSNSWGAILAPGFFVIFLSVSFII